jgi:O-methyltransferase involved in polyketide biosynthesis
MMIKSLLLRFLREYKKEKAVQVVVLGCGFDTLYFQLHAEDQISPNVVKYVECDFEDVIEAKKGIIHKHLGDLRAFGEGSPYKVFGVDVRQVDCLFGGLENLGVRYDIPTFFLAECVLVYMNLNHSNELLRKIASKFEESTCVIYEQVNPDDPFGRQMMINLHARGCPLRGIIRSLEEQKTRMIQCGWQGAICSDMLTLFKRCISKSEISRINELEMLDEEEEWNLLLQHYCITCAKNSIMGHELEDFAVDL